MHTHFFLACDQGGQEFFATKQKPEAGPSPGTWSALKPGQHPLPFPFWSQWQPFRRKSLCRNKVHKPCCVGKGEEKEIRS